MGPGWGGPPFGPGRRFRRGAFVVLLVVALLVAALATILASIIAGNAPAPGITIAVSIAVLAGSRSAADGSGGTRARSAR